MLTVKKEYTLTGESKIDGVVAESYRAVINSENPIDMVMSSVQRDKVLYKANRVICRQDSADFEEIAFAMQDQLISESAQA